MKIKDVSLYIHIPFCKQKCKYCDFPSFAGKECLENEYIDALIKEIKNKAIDYKIKTVFIGGGTPSYLSNENLKKLLNVINTLKLNDELEFTMECNPGTLTKEKLQLMKSKNVNRLSIGLQSCNDKLLKDLGRIHSFEEFYNNFKLAREVGFSNINVDLMFALPNQSIKDLENTLDKICSLDVEHISAYSLIVEEGTPFYTLYENDKLNLPSEDIEREMYNITVKKLKDYGYNHYEISNFSKPNKECRHNLTYWEVKEYVGCGSAAASYIDNVRYKNICDIKSYIKAINKNKSVFEEITNNKLKDNMEEFMFLGLRKIKGISKKDFFNRFKVDIYRIYKDVIVKHCNQGLLVDFQDKIYLTDKGIELSNYVMSDFILD